MGQQEFEHWREGAARYAEGAVDEAVLKMAYDRMFGGVGL
jgi:hypothetical protein